MEHPDLPGQPIEVNDAAVVHYGIAGWVVTDPPPPPPRMTLPVPGTTTDDAPADAGVSASEPDAPRRRRAPKEGDEK